MIRLIFLAVVLILFAVAGFVLALEHYFGWKALIALPFVLVLVVWLSIRRPFRVWATRIPPGGRDKLGDTPKPPPW